MKKIKLALFALTMLILFIPFKSNAQRSGEWKYSIWSGEVTLEKYYGGTQVTIPSYINGYPVTTLGEELFENSNITSVSIPVGIETIDMDAFKNCRYLTSIYYNAKNANADDVRGIFTNAGKYSSSLTVTIGSSVEAIPSLFECSEEEYSNVTKVKMSNKVKYIRRGAFSNCFNLKSINLSSNLREIGTDAFYNCQSLKGITIPSKVEEIWDDAFYNCKYLTQINFNAVDCNVLGSATFANAGKFSGKLNVVFGKGVKKVPESVLCTNEMSSNYCHVTSVTIPSSVKEIGYCAFKDCKDLKTITNYSKKCEIMNCLEDVKRVTLKCYRGSTMASFAKENGFKVSYLDPKAISIKSLKKGRKQVKVTWKKGSGLTGYEIQVATNTKFTKNKKTVRVAKKSITSTTVKKLKAKKKYYVRVRTYKTMKIYGKSTRVYSSWSKTKSVKTK